MKEKCSHKICGTCKGIKRAKGILGKIDIYDICSPHCVNAHATKDGRKMCECKCKGKLHMRGEKSPTVKKLLNSKDLKAGKAKEKKVPMPTGVKVRTRINGAKRRTKAEMMQAAYNREVDLYKWYVVDLKLKKAVTGFEYRNDALDEIKDYEPKENFKVVAKQNLKSFKIKIPNEEWKSL